MKIKHMNNKVPVQWEYLGKYHVLAATKMAGWQLLCRAKPEDYENMMGQPDTVPTVMIYDLNRITCDACKAMVCNAEVTEDAS